MDTISQINWPLFLWIYGVVMVLLALGWLLPYVFDWCKRFLARNPGMGHTTEHLRQRAPAANDLQKVDLLIDMGTIGKEDMQANQEDRQELDGHHAYGEKKDIIA